VPRNPRADYSLATLILQQTPPAEDEADTLFRHALSLDSNYADGWDGLAQMAVVHHRLPEAKALLEREIAIPPAQSRTLLDLGGVLIDMHRPAEAIPYLERALAIEVTPPILFTLGRAYAQAGRSDDAARAYLRLADLDPARVDAISDAGAALIAEGRARDAIPYLEHVARVDPISGINLARLSLAYVTVGRTKDAVATGAHAIERAGTNADVYAVLGQAMLHADSLSSAEIVLGKALQLNPDDVGALTTLGDTKLARGKTSDAVELYRRALAIDSTFPPARDAMARAQRGK
jgi:tetratricopeptide (TPR) repeat protein